MILILKGFDVLVLVLIVPFFVLFLGFVSFWFVADCCLFFQFLDLLSRLCILGYCFV